MFIILTSSDYNSRCGVTGSVAGVTSKTLPVTADQTSSSHLNRRNKVYWGHLHCKYNV